MALDLASWLCDGGKPTNDQYYADPENPRLVVTKKGEAILIERAAPPQRSEKVGEG